ncbi:MAG TPA: hypothetical protein VHW67_08325 [Solirubrobacteraceae bacterium]|nr:hypothetical protein [Solirubrobacteraceae bacterium]
MPTFCRHGRFLERCPICSKALPGNAPERRPGGGSSSRRASGSAGAASRRGAARGSRGGGLHVRHQQRAVEDGYSSELLPGLRASADAARLAQELAFASGRLLVLSGSSPGSAGEERPVLPDLYAEARALAASDLEQASWICFLSAYLCPLEDEGVDAFAGIRLALQSDREQLEDLEGVALGPRSSHDPARGAATLSAYRGWYRQAGSQALAFEGDSSWTPQRRFERLFERLALPGLSRAARYELLVLLGTLGLYPLQADSLHLSGARATGAEDATILAAKRIFAIGDPLLLERRARALAEASDIPLAALDLALSNWDRGERATLGFPAWISDEQALVRTQDALGL